MGITIIFFTLIIIWGQISDYEKKGEKSKGKENSPSIKVNMEELLYVYKGDKIYKWMILFFTNLWIPHMKKTATNKQNSLPQNALWTGPW